MRLIAVALMLFAIIIAPYLMQVSAFDDVLRWDRDLLVVLI